MVYIKLKHRQKFQITDVVEDYGKPYEKFSVKPEKVSEAKATENWTTDTWEYLIQHYVEPL